MKKQFSILLVSAVIIGLTLSLSRMSLVSQTASAEKSQNSYRQAPKSVPVTNIKVVKKVFLAEDMEKLKGRPSSSGKDKPSPPGKDKNKKGAATGELGSLATGNKYAIVIGICDYPGKDHDICKSDGDSLHMYKAITELYGYKAENVKLFKDAGGTTGFVNPTTGEKITAEIPTRSNILGAIDEMRLLTTSQDDEVFFFFSGHGAKGDADDSDAEDTDEAIVVHDNDGVMDTDGYSTLDFIWDGELRSWFDGFATTRIAFVFDTCRAGGMNDVVTDVNGVVVDGRVISMATEETRSAYVYSKAGEDVDKDGQPDGEGVFSRLFVNEGMLQGLADVYYHGIDDDNPETLGEDVVVEEAFDYAKENIPPYLKRRQKPVISDKFTNDLLL